MKNVAELVKKRPRRRSVDKWNHVWPLPDTLMGIEVEVEREEGVVLPSEPLSMWSMHHDGSLQNGVEYVLTRPMAGSDLRIAIDELMSAGTFTRTLTGSTHIHMDMLEDDTSPEILRTMVMLVYALEPLLYAAGDPSREWCGYANRLMTGPDTIISTVMNEAITPEQFRRTYARGSSTFGRYYGLNMAALLDYGSLEFRYFPTATSEQELLNWVELVQTFKLAATSVGGRDALGAIVEDEERFVNFLQSFFGKWSHLFSSLGQHSELRNNYRKAIITANVSTDKEVFFRAFKVLGNKKFNKLLKFPPKEVKVTDAGTYRILEVEPNQMIPPANDYPQGVMLLYMQNLYHTSDIGYGRTNARQQHWRTFGESSTSHYLSDEVMVNTLFLLLENFSGTLTSHVHQQIVDVLEGSVIDDISYESEEDSDVYEEEE